MSVVRDPSLNDYLVRMLLRFFRRGEQVSIGSGVFSHTEDLEYLRIQWAFSRQVEDLARHLLENRHEAQASLDYLSRQSTAYVRGKLEPTKTVLQRRITGNTSIVCYKEPRKTYSAGTNHVLTWVLRYSDHLLRTYVQMLSGSDVYQTRIRQICSDVGQVQHLSGIGEAVASANIRVRPSTKSLAQAGASRKPLYQKAFKAYRSLASLESGSSTEAIKLLNDSLIAPLEEWQKFELAVALRMAQVLSDVTGQRLKLHPIEQGSSRPIASVGKFDVYWQNATAYQRFPELEPSEVVTRAILQSYQVVVGSDRPDVVVTDREAETVVAVTEAKFSFGETWKDAFREAAGQLVRYSKLYRHCVPQAELLRRSIIAVSNLPTDITGQKRPLDAPIAYGMENILGGDLAEWVERIVATCL